MMRAITITVAGMAAAALAAGATAAPAPAPKTLPNPELTAFQLIQRFENNLAPNRARQLSAFLSRAFIIRRADGTTANRAQYLRNHPYYPDWQAKVYDAEYAAPVLTVSSVAWALSVPGAYNPGLFSFAWQDGGWKLTGFARFASQSTLPPTG